MKPFKILIAIAVLSAVGQLSYSQVLKPGEVAKNDGTNRVNNNESNVIDQGLGKTESALKGLFKKKKPAAAATSNQPVATPPLTNGPATQQGSGGGSLTAYNNFDFIPGDQIVFFDDFADDQDGEFPAHWNLHAGQAVLNQVAGKRALLITDGNYGKVNPLIKSASYLNDPFTIEFDNYSNGGNLPHIFLYNTNADASIGEHEVGQIDIGEHNSHGGVEVSHDAENGTDLVGSYPPDIASDNYLNKWHHISIAFKKNQMKVYVDQYRVLTVPNLGFTPHAFDIEGIASAAQPIAIANFRVANGGGMNMLGKKFTDAKIVTHGINFDVDQATIKPESMGTLNMIAGILKDNPDLKFEVDGHTDNTGTSPHNLTLSQQRAQAVKAQLVTLGVDAARLTTKGFGDSKPISDNLTPEGKANNRRVEFVKQ